MGYDLSKREDVLAALRESEKESGIAYAALEKYKAEIAEAGINVLASEHAAEFEKVDGLGKAYDVAKGHALQLQTMHARLGEIDGIRHGGNAGGGMQQFSGELRGYGAPRVDFGKRFTQSGTYKSMHESGVFKGQEARFLNAMRAGIDPVEIWSKDEFMAGMEFLATTVTGGGATSVAPFIVNDLQAGFVAYARKRPLLASIVGNATTDSDVVEYVTQTAPTDAAAETAEDTGSSESTYAFTNLTTNVREITHSVPVTNRAMADYGQVEGIIRNELSLGALDRLDTQIASGAGTGQNLAGIYNTTGIGTQPLVGDNRPDCLHKAITKIRVAAGILSEPDYIGMHPNDWQKLRIEKDADGQYLMGPPGIDIPLMSWGIPVLMSVVFTEGTPVVGDFGGSARLWTREGLAVTSGLDGNDFTKRRVTLLAALRVAFAVIRPGGFVTPTGF